MRGPSLQGFDATFDRTLFERLAAAEPGHFWFEERNRLLLWVLRRYFPRAASFCEVGCGSGGVLAAIEAGRPSLELTGVEYYPEALALAARRLKRTRLQLGDIGALPFHGEFDVVGCFDVLEHILDDRLALTNLARSVKPGGGLILTVPQGPFLWSAFDELAHHQRRYRARDLCEKVRACGLICQRISSFMTFLLPAMWLSRLRRRPYAELLERQLHPTAGANRIGTVVLGCERRLISAGMSFPYGASLLVIATKPPL